MKLAEISKIYAEQTKQLSDAVRPLALAGIALIWVFKQEVQGRPVLAKRLVAAGVFIIIALLFDLLQYAWGNLAYKNFYWAKMTEGDEMLASGTAPEGFNKFEYDWDPPPHINKGPQALFWSKIAFTLLGHLLILNYLIDHLDLF